MYDPANFRLDGEVAIVTGGGAGIGRAIAETFSTAGAAVMVSDLKAEKAEAVALQITERGGKAASMACDVTMEDDLANLVLRTSQRFGKVTSVVSNAGGGGPKPFDMPMADFRRAYDLNVFSLFRLAQLAAPEMEKAGGGSILAITSMAAENKNRRMAAYASSKAATSHLVRNIAFDLGPKSIRVNGIAPGATRTEALELVLNPETEALMLAHTPIARLGTPQDMANAALFLCSPASSWISGQILTVREEACRNWIERGDEVLPQERAPHARRHHAADQPMVQQIALRWREATGMLRSTHAGTSASPGA